MMCNAWQQRIAEVGGAAPLPDDLAAHVADCPECAAVYWPGSHYDRMRKIVDELGAGLDAASIILNGWSSSFIGDEADGDAR